jgi:hypothetical protein
VRWMDGQVRAKCRCPSRAASAGERNEIGGSVRCCSQRYGGGRHKGGKNSNFPHLFPPSLTEERSSLRAAAWSSDSSSDLQLLRYTLVHSRRKVKACVSAARVRGCEIFHYDRLGADTPVSRRRRVSSCAWIAGRCACDRTRFSRWRTFRLVSPGHSMPFRALTADTVLIAPGCVWLRAAVSTTVPRRIGAKPRG